MTMICERCGASCDTDAPLCVPCAVKVWTESFERARAQAKVLLPLVTANTEGPGEAVLSLLLLAHAIHRKMAGLPPFDFYVEAVVHGGKLKAGWPGS